MYTANKTGSIMRQMTQEDREYRQGRSIRQYSETWKLIFFLFTVGTATIVAFTVLASLGLF